MTRFSLATLLAASLAGPWSGCERDPVSPPAAPPSERAPAEPGEGGGTMLLPSTRRLA
jgi:hypothetical protein